MARCRGVRELQEGIGFVQRVVVYDDLVYGSQRRYVLVPVSRRAWKGCGLMRRCCLAIIHYSPDPKDCAIIQKEEVSLSPVPSCFNTFFFFVFD